MEKEYQSVGENPGTNEDRAKPTVAILRPPLDERILSALRFGGYLAKQILPYFIAGLIAVSYVEAYLPPRLG